MEPSQAKEIIVQKMVEINEPIEKTMKNSLNQANKEQQELIQKIQDMAKLLETIESTLPPTDYGEMVNKILNFCDRFENSRHRIQRVSQRAQRILQVLESKRNSEIKTSKVQD